MIYYHNNCLVVSQLIYSLPHLIEGHYQMIKFLLLN